MVKSMWKRSFLFVVFVATLAINCGTSDKTKTLTVDNNSIGEVTGRLKVVLTFSSEMVKPDQIDKKVESPVSFSPKIDGEAKWLDTRTLVFNSDRYLPVSTTFTAKVKDGIVSLDGSRLKEPHTFEFFTKRIEGEAGVAGSPERAQVLQVVALDFNQKIPFEQISKNCSYKSKAKTLDVKLESESEQGPAKSFRVIPAGELSQDTEWTFICKNGLLGAEGNTGTKGPIARSFHTYGPFNFIKTDPSGNDIVPEEGLQLAIAFSNPLKKPYKIKIEPAVSGFPERSHSL